MGFNQSSKYDSVSLKNYLSKNSGHFTNFSSLMVDRYSKLNNSSILLQDPNLASINNADQNSPRDFGNINVNSSLEEVMPESKNQATYSIQNIETGESTVPQLLESSFIINPMVVNEKGLIRLDHSQPELSSADMVGDSDQQVYLAKRSIGSNHMAGFSDGIPRAVKTNKILYVKKSVDHKKIKLPKLKPKIAVSKPSMDSARLEQTTARRNAETLPDISAPNSPKLF